MCFRFDRVKQPRVGPTGTAICIAAHPEGMDARQPYTAGGRVSHAPDTSRRISGRLYPGKSLHRRHQGTISFRAFYTLCGTEPTSLAIPVL